MQTVVLKETRYSKHGKLLEPISDRVFIEGMRNADFKKLIHCSYAVLIYYSAVRRQEALRCIPEQFQVLDNKIVFEVGKRLKHGINTPPLVIPRDAPFVEELVSAIKETPRTQDIKNGVEGTRIWKFCPKTAYNIIDRAFGFYPHFFRLSRITNFFLKGWTIAQVHSWTGLSLRALDFYLGLVDVDRMGMSLSKK